MTGGREKEEETERESERQAPVPFKAITSLGLAKDRRPARKQDSLNTVGESSEFHLKPEGNVLATSNTNTRAAQYGTTE